MNYKLLDDAVADALCPMFQALVPATSTIAVVAPFFGPKGIAASLVASSVSNLSMLGASATCSEVEPGDQPYRPEHCCQEVRSRGQLFYRNTETGIGGPGTWQYVKRIIRTYEGEPLNGPGTEGGSICEYEQSDGQIASNGCAQPFSKTIWCIDPVVGDFCTDGAPEPPLQNPPVPDHTYVDQTTNCTYIVKFEGFIRETEDGPIQPVFQISSENQTRANGGRMGGCNLSPVIYTPGPNGPGGPGGPRLPPIPVPPNPPGPIGGVPWWAGPLLGGATGAALTLIGQELAKLTTAEMEAGDFTLTAPCDYTEEGDNKSYFFPFPKGTYQQRVIDHQMAILETLQYHLNSKTPTCSSNAKPPLEGEWVTTRWESEEVMPHSGHRLRKQFRYRSKSGLPLQERSAYWEWFQWQSGDVCVIHKGAWWGTPQVWAASEEEGKRVIRFAAGEAGLDPDQVGEWVVSSSDSPRYGMSGTMKIRLYKGFPWITSRGGASYPMALAKVHDP